MMGSTTSDFVASLTYISLTLMLSELARLAISFSLTPGFVRRCIQEFVATFELCAVCYELSLVCEVYGKAAYGVSLFLVTIWWSLLWDQSTACPFTHILDWLDGTVSALQGVTLILVNVIGGSIFFRFYLQYVWKYFQLGHTHVFKMTHPLCRSDIQTYTLLAALIECGGVLICSLISRYLNDMNQYTLAVINSFVGSVAVVAAITTSGGYFNPILASALQYGCEGATLLEHFTVYWIGPCGGAILARDLFSRRFNRGSPTAPPAAKPARPATSRPVGREESKKTK